MIEKVKSLRIYCMLRDIYHYLCWRYGTGYKNSRKGIDRKFARIMKSCSELAGVDADSLPKKTLPRLS